MCELREKSFYFCFAIVVLLEDQRFYRCVSYIRCVSCVYQVCIMCVSCVHQVCIMCVSGVYQVCSMCISGVYHVRTEEGTWYVVAIVFDIHLV